MSSRSIFTRVLAFAIAFTMVMSAASVAFAGNGTQNLFTNGRPKDGIQTVDIESGTQSGGTNHRVEFKVGAAVVSAQLVADGGHAMEPSQPAIPSGYNSFLGWYTAETGGSAFAFETTAVTAPLTLYAHFSTNFLVKFYDAQNKVFHSVEVAPGATVSAPANPTPPAKKVFRSWHIIENGVLAAAEYVFSTPVNSNFTLAPKFADTFYVFFISRGTTVTPQIVVSGDQATLPAAPTRAGYTFQHWSLTDGGAAYTFATPVTADTTLYAVWQAQTVDYTLVYWLEKPNVSGDPGTDTSKYAFYKSVTKQAVAGTQVTFTAGQLDSIARAQYSHTVSPTIAGNGTSVVNVYFKRIVYTLVFDLNPGTYNNSRLGATMIFNGTTYAQGKKPDGSPHSGTIYSFTAKYEQDIEALWPSSANATFARTYYYKWDGNWYDNGTSSFTNWSGTWVSKRFTLNDQLFDDNDGISGTTITFKASWGSVNARQVNYWLERLPGETGTPVDKTYDNETRSYIKSTKHSQPISLEGGLNPKAIGGMVHAGSDPFSDNTYNFYYKRNRHTLSFNLVGGVQGQLRTGFPTGVSTFDGFGYNKIMFEAALSYYEPLTIPTRTGYSFEGWYYDAEYNLPFDFATATMPDSDVMLFAKWESTQYEVRFYNGVGGTELAELRVGKAENEYVQEPTTYVKGTFYENFGVFGGWYWYLDAGNTYLTSYSWETPVTGNLNLYAVWITDGFKLTYNAGAGTGTVPVDNDTYALNVLAPVQGGSGLTANISGQSFVGWKVNGTSATYYTGSTVPMAGNITLVAYYADMTQATKITFHPNFTTPQQPVEWNVLNNETVALAGAGIFTREKYTIVGWSNTLGGTTVDHALNAEYTVTGAKTFYAVWARSNVSVQFVSDSGGTLSGTPLWANLPYNTAWTSITVPTPVANANYAFAGWYWNNGTGARVDDGTNAFPANITDDLVFRAKWKPITVENVYTVKYLTNPGETGVVWPADIVKNTSADQTLTAATKVGAAFSGWKLNNTGSVITALDSTDYTMSAVPVKVERENDFLWTYEWIAEVHGSFTNLNDEVNNFYTVIYSLDGTPVTEHDAVTTMPTVVKPDAEQAGYTFTGWYQQGDGTKTKLTALAQGNYVKDTVLSNETAAGPGTAKIINNYYTITLVGEFTKNIHKVSTYEITYTVTDTVGGLTPADAVFKTGKSVTDSGTTALAMPVPKDGYKISGTWTITGGGLAQQSIAGAATFTWGTPVVTTEATPTHNESGKLYFVETSAYTLAATAVVEEDRGEPQSRYTLTYTIEGTYIDPSNGNAVISVTAPAAVTQSTPPTPLAAGPSVKGHAFDGWKQMRNGTPVGVVASTIEWTVSGTADEVIGGKLVAVTTYTATVVGTYTQKTATENYYKLTYDGTAADKAIAGAEWPANIPYGAALTSAPALAQPLTVDGYTFTGWTGADWALDETQSGIVYENDTFVTKNYYSKTVTGSFTKNTLNTYDYTITYMVSGVTSGLASPATTTWTKTGAAPFAADALPGLKPGYKITGWTIGTATVAGGGELPWALDAGSGVENAQPTKILDIWYFVTPHTYTLAATAVVEEDRGDAVVEYNLTYLVAPGPYYNPETGLTNLPLTGMPSNIIKGAAPTDLGGTPSVQGYTFSGWQQGDPATAVNTVGGIAWTDSTADEVRDGKIVSVTTRTATLTGSFTLTQAEESQWGLTYEISPATYTAPDGTALTITNTPANVSPAVGMTKPVIAGAPALDGHTFIGWKQGGTVVNDTTLNWGTAAVSYRYDVGTQKFIKVSTYTATLTGTFEINTIVQENYYTLTYAIVGGPYYHGDGVTELTTSTPANVSDEMRSAAPTLAAGIPLDGHSFNGWLQGQTPVAVGAAPEYTQVGATAYRLGDDGAYIATKHFTAAVTGSYATNGLDEVTNWILTYTGDSALADAGTWPSSPVTATGAGNAPTLTTLIPAKTGYTFSGWTPDPISWSASAPVYTLSNNKYVKTITNTATVNGTLTKNGSIDEYIYIVDYTVTGGDPTILYNTKDDVEAVNPATLPTIIAQPTETNKVFSGWTPASLDWDSVTATEVPDARYDEAQNKWVTTHTKTIAVSGSFAGIQDVNVTRYSLNFIGQSYATLPSNIDRNPSEPGFPGTPGAPANYRFDGWYQDGIKVTSIAWSTPVADGEPVLEGTTRTQYYLSTATLEARFVETNEHHTYTLHYEVTGTIGTEQNPIADDVSTTGEITPALGKVAATIGENSFTGWSITSGWTTVQGATEMVNGVEITYYTHEATATGSYAQIIGERERSLYNVIYTGPAGASPWPANVNDADAWPDPMPTNMAPYLAGYNFTGWVLVDANVRIIRTVEETPCEGDNGDGENGEEPTLQEETVEIVPFEEGQGDNGNGDIERPKCYIVVVTTVYTNTYRATFTSIGGEDPIEPEIPLGVPHTGAEEQTGVAAILAISGMAVMTGALIHRRRDEDEQGE